uniref:outer membrane beta-barrel protein n=1 Tax=Cellvibrio fontiphilus TaxID=1815559 RepID=UPI002B4BEE4B|nr:outer membrane beta-barrel protein [Cellvibrio fontiphilus]
MRKRLVSSLCSLALASSAGAFAQGQSQQNNGLPLAYHVSGQATYTRIKAAGEHFSPSLFQLRADVEVTNGILDGIGLQGMLGVPMSDDKKHGMTMDISQQSGAYITLANPDYQPGDIRVVVLLGYTSTELETHLPTLGNAQKDRFGGFSYGFSLQDRVMEGKNYYWSLDCARYFKDDNLRIDGCGLGVSYAF